MGFKQTIESSLGGLRALMLAGTLATTTNAIAQDVNSLVGTSEEEIATKFTELRDLPNEWAVRPLSNGMQIRKTGNNYDILKKQGDEWVIVSSFSSDEKGEIKRVEPPKDIQKKEGTFSFNPGVNGGNAAYRDPYGNLIIEGGMGASSLFGQTVKGSVATSITENSAGALTVEVGADLTRIIASIGGKITPEGTIIFSGEHLEANQKFMFTSGEVKEKVKQDKYGVALRIKLTDGLLESFVASGAITKADSLKLANKEFTIDNATMFTIADNYRNIAGGTKTEVSAGFVFKTSENGRLELRVKQENATWDAINSTIPSVSKTGGDAIYRHANIFRSGINVEVKGGTGISGNTAGLGANVKIGPSFLDNLGVGGGNIGLEYNHVQGLNGMKGNDTTMLTYRVQGNFLGGDTVNNSGKSLKSTTPNFATQAFGSIVEEVLRTNQGFASQTLLHKVDEKVENKVEILKNGLPAGVNYDEQGNISVNTLNITGIASITKDGGAFTNAGQFAVIGGKLVIVTKALNSIGTYVVRVDKVGGGQADITVVVVQGSMKVQSVTINDVSTNPTVSFTNSTFNKTVGDSSFTQTLTSNSPGAITYSSNNTGVATVNSTTGAVTIVGAGTAIITANQVASGSYSATSATYTVNVSAAAVPSFSSISNITISDVSYEVATTVDFSTYCTNCSGGTWSATGLPDGMTINTSTGAVSTNLFDASALKSNRNDTLSYNEYNVTISYNKGGTTYNSNSFNWRILDGGRN